MFLTRSHESWRSLAVLLLGTFLLFGCSSSDLPSGPKGTVQGKVTYKGDPVPAGSTIMFVHEESSLPATGQIGTGGAYTLTMQGSNEVLAGKYVVSVSPPASSEVSEETDMDAYKAAMEGGAGTETPTGPFPEKYQSAETSGETFEVKEGENTFDVDMKDESAGG